MEDSNQEYEFESGLERYLRNEIESRFSRMSNAQLKAMIGNLGIVGPLLVGPTLEWWEMCRRELDKNATAGDPEAIASLWVMDQMEERQGKPKPYRVAIIEMLRKLEVQQLRELLEET